MGTWSERYLKNKSASLGKSTAKNCQYSETRSLDRILSASGSGFRRESEKYLHSTERKDIQKSLTGITAKSDKTQQQPSG